MADILVSKDGTKTTVTLSATVIKDQPGLSIRVGPAAGGGDVYVRQAVLANGDVEYRFSRHESIAK